MRKWITLFFVAGSMCTACQSTESTQSVRDNETPVTAKDQVDDRQIPPDTLVTDTTTIR